MTLSANTKRNLAIAFLVLIGLGSFLVFYRFLEVPRYLTFDEIEFAKLAVLLKKLPWAPYNSYATGHATLYFYILQCSLSIFGITTFGLRLPAAVFGVLAPLVLYGIARLLIPRTQHLLVTELFPFLMAFLLITSRWYLNFARFSFEVTFLLLLELLSLFFILSYERWRRLRFIMLSGIFAGLAYNSYQPGRIFFLVPLFMLVFHVIGWRRLLRLDFKPLAHKKRLLVASFLAPFITLILPLTIYLSLHKDIRMFQQFYPDNHEMTLPEKWGYFTRNLTSTALIFNVRGDMSGRHNYPGKPALNPITGTLFLAGLGIALWRIKRRENQVFALWFILALIPTLVTYPWENPNMLRTYTVLPSVIYFVILPLITLSRHPLLRTNRAMMLFIASVVLLCTASAVYEMRTYFVHQSAVFEEAFEAHDPLIRYFEWER